MPTFDSACFGANSPLFIPAFKGSRKPTSNNSKTKPVDEREARERLKARKDHIRRLAAVDDVIRYDKYHAANLLATSNSTTTTSQQRVSGTSLSTSTAPNKAPTHLHTSIRTNRIRARHVTHANTNTISSSTRTKRMANQRRGTTREGY
jgi:hypothetical protein